MHPYLQAILWQLVRCWHRIVIWYRKKFIFNKEFVSQDEASLYYPNHTEEWMWSALREPYPEDCIVVREVSRMRHSGRAEYRSIILPNHPQDVWETIQPPWWLVGAQMDDGNMITITDALADFLVIGNRITPTLLERVNRDIPSDRLLRWVYVHPETFEEREFPLEGIVIKRYGDTATDSTTELPHEE